MILAATEDGIHSVDSDDVTPAFAGMVSV